MMIYLKMVPCGLWCQRGRKILFTKIDSKKRRRIDKRRGSTKILSTQVGGASS
jgi:hypothetical protein